MKAFGDYLFEMMAGPNQANCSISQIAFSWICVWCSWGAVCLFVLDDWREEQRNRRASVKAELERKS